MGPVAGIRSLAPTVNPTSRGAGQPQAETWPTRPLETPADPAAPAASPASESSGSRSGGGRPLATFLSHLIATAQDAPQTRRLRRAAVSEALSAYGAAAGLVEGGKARPGGSGEARAA